MFSSLVKFVAAPSCLIAAVAISLDAAPLAAQQSASRTVICGNLAGDQVQCKTGGYATGVRLTRSRGPATCVQGTNWGFTDSFIWTNKGCGGDFEVTYRVTIPPVAPGSERVQCGRINGDQVECKLNGYATNVRLVKSTGPAACSQGKNWGFNSSSIWTNKYCRGEFEVTYRATAPATRTITCGSASGANVSCNPLGTVASVRLRRELSRGQCRQNVTWGYTSDNLWTKGRCHAQFEVTYRVVPQPR